MRPPRGGGGFRGRDGGRGRGGGRFGGGRFGGRGGGFRDEGPPAEVIEISTFLHACEGDAVTKLTNEKIPYFNAPIYLQNKTQIGKVDEIFGPINESVSIKTMSAGRLLNVALVIIQMDGEIDGDFCSKTEECVFIMGKDVCGKNEKVKLGLRWKREETVWNYRDKRVIIGSIDTTEETVEVGDNFIRGVNHKQLVEVVVVEEEEVAAEVGEVAVFGEEVDQGEVEVAHQEVVAVVVSGAEEDFRSYYLMIDRSRSTHWKHELSRTNGREMCMNVPVRGMRCLLCAMILTERWQSRSACNQAPNTSKRATALPLRTPLPTPPHLRGKLPPRCRHRILPLTSGMLFYIPHQSGQPAEHFLSRFTDFLWLSGAHYQLLPTL
ncbi:hypothetical protein ACLOJK_005778 [Asimina triloba]